MQSNNPLWSGYPCCDPLDGDRRSVRGENSILAAGVGELAKDQAFDSNILRYRFNDEIGGRAALQRVTRNRFLRPITPPIG
jgi:hypothetical protein